MKLKILLVVLISLLIIKCGNQKPINVDIYYPEARTLTMGDENFVKAWEMLRAGKPDKAIDYLENSTVNDEELYTAFGYAYLLKNKLKYAKKNFNRVLEINKDNLKANIGIALIHEKINDLKSAFLIYSDLLSKNPDVTWIKVRYDFIKNKLTQIFLAKAEEYKTSDEEKYIKYLKQVIFYSPELIDVVKNIGDYYFNNQDYEQARIYYEKYIHTSSNNIEVLVNLAKSYEYLDKFDSAIVIYNKILELKPGDQEIKDKMINAKLRFQELNFPPKFKRLFFKKNLNREDIAALIGYYFDKYLELDRRPVIITDVSGSYAMKSIIKLVTLNIIKLRPDHTFDRYTEMSRVDFAIILDRLINYLQQKGVEFNFNPSKVYLEPSDISTINRYFEKIRFIINSQIMKLDGEGRFNPLNKISPSDALSSIKKILNSMIKKN